MHVKTRACDGQNKVLKVGGVGTRHEGHRSREILQTMNGVVGKCQHDSAQ